ncbi:MAG: NADH-quinone oxidoreductase subunit A [Ignavibacteria bacterium]|jgi:NADH-quinone oxidoreductase subunit A|nr:NADH-quinone oxidoreductase subunit A [Ignavibacteria bacterium]MCU7500338.1 NADH-quinone oxidoreductase subunit A [Ignavibacteria bacterium]MCU7501776.1 NADH-quinone oxidoreductase subunit A [Ignavibacteria bacterium]MCU7516817.1 NADH-quinone oxidoreductase subunit A [Ignavibacteria bacterium]
MLTEFGKIFIFLLLAIFFVIVAVLFSKFIRPARPTKEKLLTYECGENPEGSPWIKFNIRFYVVALIFLIFDVEVVLLFPWALSYKEFGLPGFLVGAIFLIVLGLGMAYEWRKGDLEWARPVIQPPVLKKQTYSKDGILVSEEKAKESSAVLQDQV